MDIQTIITTVITSSVVTGLGILGLQTLLKQGISHQFNKKIQEGNHHFNRELASFNEKITISAEKRKLDFDRMIHDFSLYSKKRHDLYPELFKQIYQINHELKGLESTVLSLVPSIHMNNTREKLVTLFADLGITINHWQTIDLINDLHYMVKEDRTGYMVEVKDIIMNDLLLGLMRELEQLKKNYMENRLYISDNVLNKTDKLLESLTGMIYSKVKQEKSVPEFNKDNIQRMVDELEQMLKQELAVGDYS